MDELDQRVVEKMFDSHPRFRMLYEEHLLFEKEIQNLDTKKFLNPEEELERRKIQKFKLAGKDEMMWILKQHFR